MRAKTSKAQANQVPSAPAIFAWYLYRRGYAAPKGRKHERSPCYSRLTDLLTYFLTHPSRGDSLWQSGRPLLAQEPTDWASPRAAPTSPDKNTQRRVRGKPSAADARRGAGPADGPTAVIEAFFL
jgi:hypothetical protein